LEVSRALQALDNLRPADRQAMNRARTAIAAAEEREAAFQRAFHSNWQPRDRTAVYGARVAPGHRAEPSGDFRAQHGRLPFPVAGRAEIQSVRSPTGQGKALVMVSSPGALVRSVHPGRVAFADDYPGLGNTVILDHGGQHYTVSAHLDRISVSAGDELSSGQAIGTVGTYDQQPGLLFEVRSGQTTLDSPKWFGL
jgi:septal ring factor EnvC (AmiA/AmiB activator)